MEFVLIFVIGICFGLFFGICGMKAISVNKPNAIFHMTEIDNDIESWIEFEDDPTLFKDGEEMSVIVKKEKTK